MLTIERLHAYWSVVRLAFSLNFTVDNDYRSRPGLEVTPINIGRKCQDLQAILGRGTRPKVYQL